MNIIADVEENSIAFEMGIEKGDLLLAINDVEIKDILDYRYVIHDEFLTALIRKPDGEEWLLEIDKDEMEDLGLVFENDLMDHAKSCTNKCIFCFIDQLPKGMRDTLYFKDDDSRLSFFDGNYITMTNLKKEDIERILYYHLSPINISVHTTDPELRQFMLKNPNSKKLPEYLKMLYDGKIEMNFQIVLCKNVNDGENLNKSIEDLSAYLPYGKSLSIVPVGITKYREGLFEHEPFTKEASSMVIRQVKNYQNMFKETYGTNFVFASDEFYLTAGEALPDYETYEDFPQIENGVGMLAQFQYECNEALTDMLKKTQKKKSKASNPVKTVSIVTGQAAGDFISKLCQTISEHFPKLQMNVFVVENIFFGEMITVSGLLTGQDIINALENKDLGETVLIPSNALRAEGDVFLDNISIKEMEDRLNTKVKIVKTNGFDFIQSILDSKKR